MQRWQIPLLDRCGETGSSTSFAEFVSSQELHPLVLEGCLEPVMTSHVAPYQQSLFIKLSTQLDWDSTNQFFLSIICLPQAIITVHEESIKRKVSSHKK